MARLIAATAVLLAALVCTTGARLPMAGMAPAPSMEGGKMPKADLTFILSADTASFTPEGTLVLTNPAQTTAFTAKKGQSGIYPTSYFTNVQPGSKFLSADGKWLDMPQAALYGASAQGNNQSVVLLTLGSPTYNAANKTLTFPYQFLAPVESSLKYHGGAVGYVVKDAQSGNGMSNVIGQILPGMSMNGAALFIDSNSMALQPTAETKTWWFPWWGGWGNNYYGNGYDNGYYNNGYNGGYYNNGGGYYNNNNNNNNNGWGGNNNNNNNNNGRH